MIAIISEKKFIAKLKFKHLFWADETSKRYFKKIYDEHMYDCTRQWLTYHVKMEGQSVLGGEILKEENWKLELFEYLNQILKTYKKCIRKPKKL